MRFHCFVPGLMIWLHIYSKFCRGIIECKYGENGPRSVAYTITVGKSGQVQFKTVQEAIDSIPAKNDKWIKIQIAAGQYKEKVKITRDKSCIYLEGSGRESTVIYDDAHQETDLSATFSSEADHFYAKGITFQNNYNRPLKESPANQIKQAVAVSVFGDKSAFRFCGFVGLQDTLWDQNGRHYFHQCYIEGAIDFIFGQGQSFYEECLINSTAGSLPSTAGYITAQHRNDPSSPSGFVLKKGTITGSGHSYLGRAYGPYSTVIFQETKFDDVVVPEGWDPWNYRGKEENLMYAEINCQGPGSKMDKRVPWMKKLRQGEISKFSMSSFIDQDGWVGKIPT